MRAALALCAALLFAGCVKAPETADASVTQVSAQQDPCAVYTQHAIALFRRDWPREARAHDVSEAEIMNTLRQAPVFEARLWKSCWAYWDDARRECVDRARTWAQASLCGLSVTNQ